MEGQPNSPCVVSLSPQQDDKTVWHVEIQPSSSHRAPTTFVCVIDVSGSMVNSADNGSMENTGLTRLDIVQHSLRTLIAMVNENDKICLITFSTDVKNLYSNYMTPASKVQLLKIVDSLCPDGYTNLWGGVQAGLKYCQDLNRVEHVTIMLLTDGEPTQSCDPKLGWDVSLKQELAVLQQSSGLSPSINVFGYGYQLRSDLLLMMAQTSSGIYSFIPDATMVGTVFIDFISNELSTALPSAQLHLSLIDSDYLFESNHDSTLKLDLGTIHSGQNRHGLFKIKSKEGEISSDLIIHYELKRASVPEHVVDSGTTKYDSVDIPSDATVQMQREQMHRYAFIELLKSLYSTSMFDLDQARKLIPPFLSTLQTPRTSFEQAIHDELDSVSPDRGQVTKACLKREWYDRWGVHHLLSLQRALELEQRHNFKDPSVQHFGGALFRKLNDEASELFKALPPPKPSNANHHHPIVMGNYLNVNGGCIDGDVIIKLDNSKHKPVSELRHGDILANGMMVESVLIQIAPTDSKFQVIEAATKCFVTPWHPVQIFDHTTNKYGDWAFPEEISHQDTRVKMVDRVFNVVLAPGNTPFLETDQNHRIITLCHGLDHNTVIQHSFFGGELLRKKCQYASGWKQGDVLQVESWIRNIETDLIDDVKFVSP